MTTAPTGSDCPDAPGQEDGDQQYSWYLLQNGWYSVLNGKHRTGLWQRHDLFSVWTKPDALLLQSWREGLPEVWSLRNEIEALKTAITAAMECAEGDGLYRDPQSDDPREFWEILRRAVETGKDGTRKE